MKSIRHIGKIPVLGQARLSIHIVYMNTVYGSTHHHHASAMMDGDILDEDIGAHVYLEGICRIDVMVHGHYIADLGFSLPFKRTGKLYDSF